MSLQNDPYQNVVTLLQQCARLRNKYKECEQELDKKNNTFSLSDIDEEEKLNEKLEFMKRYEKTLLDQATVIMNEHNLSNLPSLDELECSSAMS
jgi:uncharacterized protein YciW